MQADKLAAHMGVDDGSVPMCMAGGAPFGPPIRVTYVGWQPPLMPGPVVDRMKGETKPAGHEWCEECARRYKVIHRTEELPDA